MKWTKKSDRFDLQDFHFEGVHPPNVSVED